MNTNSIIIIIFSAISITLNAQTEYLTEDKDNIYWQPQAEINFSDYQSESLDNCLKFNEKYGLQMASSISFRGIVDVPKKKGKKFDKFYFAPVFCRNCSCILSEDSLGLKVDRLLFDVAEFCVRNARKELIILQEEMNADNTCTMFFTTVKNKWDEKMHSIFQSIIIDVLRDKKPEMYIEWRKTFDELLQETESYATKPEDCYRFILQKPIEKDYKMPKNIVGDMRNKAP